MNDVIRLLEPFGVLSGSLWPRNQRSNSQESGYERARL